MNRKFSLHSAFLAVIVSAAMVVTGCSAAWIKTAVADLPVLVQIATSILGIVAAAQGKGTVDPALASRVQSVGAEVQVDLQKLQALVDAYEKAPDSGNAGILEEIGQVLGVVQAQLGDILSTFHVKDAALQASVAGSVALALTTLLAIQSLLPPAPGAKVAHAAQKPPSPKALKASFNSLVKANGFGAFAIR